MYGLQSQFRCLELHATVLELRAILGVWACNCAQVTLINANLVINVLLMAKQVISSQIINIYSRNK